MKILVIGSDYGTIDLVNEAHAQGDYVIVTDYYEITSTKNLADECWSISTYDVDALEIKCRESGVEAVTFGASDPNVEAGRELAKRLGLPYYCEKDSAWNLSRNKRVFKDFCKRIGAPIATDYSISENMTDEDIAKIQFPVVVKCVDLAANVGFSYCDNADELRAAYQKAREASSNPTIICERRLYGPEFVANYILADGEPVLNHLCSEHHQPGWPANLYSVINTSPYMLKQYLEELNPFVIRMFKEAGFTEGVAWVECMRDSDGHFYLIEPGYRFCGEVTYQPYGNLIGFNPIRWMLDIAKGVKHSKADLPAPLTEAQYGSAVSYHLFGCKAGTVEKIVGLYEIEKIPGVVIDLPHRIGYDMRKHKNMGVIRFAAHSKQELIRYINIINDNLFVLDKYGENLFIRYDNFDELISQYDEGLRDFGKEPD